MVGRLIDLWGEGVYFVIGIFLYGGGYGGWVMFGFGFVWDIRELRV